MNRAMLIPGVVGMALFLSGSPVLADEPTADDYLNFFKPLVGEWTLKADLGDTTAETTFSLRLSRAGRSLVWYGGVLGPYADIESIDGYDPGTRKWKCCAFSSAGEHRVTYYSTDAKSLRGKQATFHLDETTAKPDGTTVKSQSDTTFVMGEQQVKILVKDLTVDNKKMPDQQWVFERRK